MCTCGPRARRSRSAATAPAWTRWSSVWSPSPRRWWCWKRPAASRSRSPARWPPPACPWSWSIPGRSATLPAPPGAWPRPTAWMPRRSPASPRPSEPAPRPVPDAAAQALGELVARRRQLVEMIISEGHRRRQTRDPRLGRRLEAHVELAAKRTRHPRNRSRRRGPRHPGLARRRGLARLGAGHRQDLCPHLDRRTARARPPRPPQDRGPGRGRADQPRPRLLPRPAHGHGWPRRRSHRPVHADPRPPSATIHRCKPSTSA